MSRVFKKIIKMWEHPMGNMKNGPKNKKNKKKYFFSQKFALKKIQEKKKKTTFCPHFL